MEYLGPMEAVQGRLWMRVRWYAGLQDLLKRKFLLCHARGISGHVHSNRYLKLRFKSKTSIINYQTEFLLIDKI